ncbi:DUF2787 domain-containing protein [Vibrio cholerae]|uniref:DUF2787 domain-containing protein n=1 Tax=Vibrio cholerae TaxID=666 RepID=UPI003D2FE213
MIVNCYQEIQLADSFCDALSVILRRFKIPQEAERLVLNCRDPNYYQSRMGLHPIEIQLKRESSESPWSIAFIASFSYQDDRHDSLDVELYFHLANRWCYQPDAGTADLAQPEVLDLFCSWCAAFERHLIKHAFRDIQLTLIR